MNNTPVADAAGVFFFYNLPVRRLAFVIIPLLFCFIARAQQVETNGLPNIPKDVPTIARITRLTSGNQHHFVGYYGITPWNSTGDKLFCMESSLGERLPTAEDKAGICIVDLKNGNKLTRIAETSAWNLQQGSMLHWLPTAPDKELIYNDRIDGKLVSVILNVETKQRRIIDRPVAAISPDGKHAIGIDYDRLRRIRPVTGYAGGDTTRPLINHPADDGLWLIELETGKSRLLVSTDACFRISKPLEAVRDQPFWLEHPMFSPNGEKVFLIARAFHPKSRVIVSLPLTVSIDGSGLKPLLSWSPQGASHYDWLDDRRLVLTRQDEHLLVDTAGTQAPKTLGGLERDGHCSFSPDRKWMATDTYPDAKRNQSILILNVKSGSVAEIAKFYSPPAYKGDWRCDLHPRWSRDSKRICIDSTHEGIRQVYVIDLKMPAESK